MAKREFPDRPANLDRPDMDKLREKIDRIKAQREARIKAGSDRLN